MMCSLKTAIAMLGLLCVTAVGQEPASTPQAGTPVGHHGPSLSKSELMRQILESESAIRLAEAAHAGNEQLAKLYENLAVFYEDVAAYQKSELALRRAEDLLRSGPLGEHASVLGQLARLRVITGNLAEAKKNQVKALRIRESIGDSIGIALSWNDLAKLYIYTKEFGNAVTYARKAMTVLGDNPQVGVAERIAVRQTLGSALCGDHNCGEAITLLSGAIELARTNFGTNSLDAGVAEYLLGNAYWQNGDMDAAAKWMAQGATRMKADQRWGPAVYLNAMTQYARFLRANFQFDAANSVESEVRTANAVVDVRALADANPAPR